MTRNVFTENFGLKLIAVFLAIVLWIYVTSRGQSEISIDVPIEFKSVPTGFEIVNSNVKTVSLSIKGQERTVKHVKPADIRVSLDLGKAKKGEGTYYINREDIRVPHAITVTNINPSTVKVVVGETVTKTVGIVPIIIGQPEKGYAIKSITVTPSTIVIEGIKSEIRKVKKLRTEQIDVTGADATFTLDVKLDLAGKNIRPQTSGVAVNVSIQGTGKKTAEVP
jgi:YbbR domain-containing protein